MKDKDFRREYQELKRIAAGHDALWNDWANKGPKQSDEITRQLCISSGDDLQARLTALIENNELTENQVRALKNIVFQTPGYEGAEDVNVASISVLEPYSGFAENAQEALGSFVGNLLGLGTFKVQGPRSGYMPVKIERPKTTK